MMCALTHGAVPGRWLPPLDVAPFTWIPGVIWFALKCFLVFFMFAMVKAIVPRYRYDQLMRLGWKVFPAAVAGGGGRRGAGAEGDGLARSTPSTLPLPA
ncbi:MAG: hypothetical protein AcusKO_33530 [Acuticoccus sp.]